MKKKTLLVSICALTSLAVAGSVALLANDAFNLNPLQTDATFQLNEESITEVEDYYTAVSIDDRGNTVTTKFSGFGVSENKFTVTANSLAYFTNVEPLRGVDFVSTNLSKAQTKCNQYFITYGSYNPLNVEDIFSGKYVDLKFATTDCSGYESSSITAYASFSDCRYFLTMIFNDSEDLLTLESYTFAAVCENEPAEKEVGMKTDFTESEKADLVKYGAPANFPYIGVSGYRIQNIGIGAMVSTVAPLSNIGNLIGAFIEDNYDLTNSSEVEGRYIRYYQKQNAAKTETYTYGLNHMQLPGNYGYIQYMYTEQYPYMGGEAETTWPKDNIAELSTGLANAFPDFQLENVTYQWYGGETSFGSKTAMILVSGEDATSIETQTQAYFAALDSELYNVEGYVARTVDGKYEFEAYMMGKQIGVTLTEKLTYDYFPINELSEFRECGLPELPHVSGTFTTTYYQIVATNLDSETLEAIIKLFTDIGFVESYNPHTYVVDGYSTLPYNHVQFSYYEDGDDTIFSLSPYTKSTSDNLADALKHTSTNYEAFDAIGYQGDWVAISFKYCYMENATEQTIDDIVASITADNVTKNETNISYNKTIDDELYAVVINYHLIDGVLYFDTPLVTIEK